MSARRQLPACPGCGVSPTWSQDERGRMVFSCGCNGITVETRGNSRKAVREFRALVEASWEQEFATSAVRRIPGTVGVRQ